MVQIVIVGLGGFLGAIARYLISGWVYRRWGSALPWGTLAVNVAGSFVLGFFLLLSEGRFSISPLWRSFIAVGLLGALTTFSTFSYETFALLQEQLYRQAAVNILLNVILTLAAVWLGMVSARLV